MLKALVKLAYRKIGRQKVYSFINIAGLAVGMACTILIVMWIQDELSFDMYHEKAKQIYRVLHVRGSNRMLSGYTAPPMAKALVEDFPEVLYSVRIDTWAQNLLICVQDKKFRENGIISADASIFDVFSIPFITGNPKNALTQPRSIVLTEKMAKKYFGPEDPMGKILLLGKNKVEYQITGIVKNCPRNSHLYFEAIRANIDYSTNWMDHGYFTYIVLKEGSDPLQLEAKFYNFILKHYGPFFFQETGKSLADHYKNESNYYGYRLQALTDIHLKSNDISDTSIGKGNIVYIYIFSIIAFFILLIACVNFTNLATAQSGTRSTEVGIRKVLGSHRSELIRQFLVETIVLSLISFVCALLIVSCALPAFNNLIAKELKINFIANPFIPLGLFGITILVGILAGIYPALYLSSFQPVGALKGKCLGSGKGIRLRNGLVICQFTISIFILISSLVIHNQLKFVINTQMGFEKDQILIISGTSSLGNRYEAFRQALLRTHYIKGVSNATSLPGRHFNANSYRLEGDSATERHTLFSMYGDDQLADLLDLKIVQGRYFSAERASDVSAIVINETAVKRLGLKEPVGKRFYKEYGDIADGDYATIIGVLKDFHFHSLHHKIEPMAIRCLSGRVGFFTLIKLGSKNMKDSMAYIEKTWKEFSRGEPLVASFLDEDFENLYRREKKTGQIFVLFSILAIFIASLGIFGLASFSSEQRLKEFGIRKVLGASALGIVVIASKDLLKWVLLANIIAWPISYYFMFKWLQNFAYRIDIEIWPFFQSAIMVLVIAFLTVTYHSIKASIVNPVDLLRYE